jgi:hypothetical protein
MSEMDADLVAPKTPAARPMRMASSLAGPESGQLGL